MKAAFKTTIRTVKLIVETLIEYEENMIILFDLLHSQPQGVIKFHGGGEYIKTVFMALVDRCSENDSIIVFYDQDIFIDEWVKILISKKKHVTAVDIKSIYKIEQIFKDNNIDVFYTGAGDYYYDIDIPSGVRKIMTLHDLRIVELTVDYKSAFKYGYRTIGNIRDLIKWFIAFCLPRSLFDLIKPVIMKKRHTMIEKILQFFDEVITSSNHSKYSIMAYDTTIQTNHVQVFYVPQKHVDEIKEQEKMAFGKYILMIGGDRWSKNIFRAVLALEELYEKGWLKEHKAVIVGKLPIKLQKKIKHIENYVLYDYVDAAFLQALYINCDFFVFPSLYEGFGMPPLEVMQYGKTCVVSGVTSLPEVCNGGVYHFNPYNINELQSRILQATEMKIDTAFVKQCYEKTHNRQREDLLKLCDYILGRHYSTID